jgi:predicted ester cyclase
MNVDFANVSKQLVQDVWENGKVEKLDQYVASDVIRHHAPFEDITDLNGLKQHITDLHGAYSDIRFKVDEIVVQGNSVATRGTFLATHSGTSPAMNIPATGKEVEMPFGVIDHWQDGKIVEEWAYIDHLGALQQMEVVPNLAASG